MYGSDTDDNDDTQPPLVQVTIDDAFKPDSRQPDIRIVIVWENK